MTEKDNVSMATVQMKTDYAASEVYSTASEPPPVSTTRGWGGDPVLPIGQLIIERGSLSGLTDFHACSSVCQR